MGHAPISKNDGGSHGIKPKKLNPKPPAPIQQKIFAFFPIFLTVILAPFPSGLVIYWTFNNIFTMIQQYYIQSKMTVKTT